jgi:hypothetical protein
MAGELRLAQRQGLLMGRHLSDVQFNATVILDWAERLETQKRASEQDFLLVKAALVARNDREDTRFTPENLFEDYLQAPTAEQEDSGSLDVEDADGSKLGVDYSAVEWKSGPEAVEEYEDLMRQIGDLSAGAVSGTEFGAQAGRWM